MLTSAEMLHYPARRAISRPRHTTTYTAGPAKNLTTLCTQACADSLNSWEQNVKQKCAGQNVIMDGYWIKAETFVHMYRDGHDLSLPQV